MNDILLALLFFLPAGVANSAPPVANKIPLLNRWKTPIDFGNKLGGELIFGKNKTWRGLLFGTLLGGLSAVLLYPLIGDSIEISTSNFIMGCFLGFGGLLGDIIESFFKRRIGIAPGKAWLGFDQLDYVAGAILLSIPFVRLDTASYIAIIFVFFVLHFVVSYIGYLLGIKENPFKLT